MGCKTMKCPVCKTELLNSATKCKNCGFSDLHKEFISETDAEYWRANVVGQAINVWNTMSKKIKDLEPQKGVTYKTVKDYFKSKGFTVYDQRSKGGCLWVVGDEKTLKPYLEEVKKIFGVTGDFASSKTTSYRTGWFTKESK